MTQYLIRANVKPYTVRVTFVEEAESWEDVIAQRPDAELIRIIGE